MIEGCLDILDCDGAPGDASHLVASHRSLSPGREPPNMAARLQRLPGQDFQWVLEAVVLAAKVFLDHCTSVGAAVQTILAAAKAPQQQIADAARDAREACQAAAEAAAGRWSKLLGGRARGAAEAGGGAIRCAPRLLCVGRCAGWLFVAAQLCSHPLEVPLAWPLPAHRRLAELQGVLELTDVLASLVEQYGVRGVLGLRSALQQLCKATLDSLHARSISKLTSTWEGLLGEWLGGCSVFVPACAPKGHSRLHPASRPVQRCWSRSNGQRWRCPRSSSRQ